MNITRSAWRTTPKRWAPGMYCEASAVTDSTADIRARLVENPYYTGVYLRQYWSAYETAADTFDYATAFGAWTQALADWSAGGSSAIDARDFKLVIEMSYQSFVGRQTATPLHYVPSTHSWFITQSADALYNTWQIGTASAGAYDDAVFDALGPSSSLFTIKPHWQAAAFGRAYGAALRQLAQDIAADAQGSRVVALTTPETSMSPEQDTVGGSAGIWQAKIKGHQGAAANEAAMVALSDSLPGDTCYRTDTASVWMLQSGGTYSTAAHWLDSDNSANHAAMADWQATRTYRNLMSEAFKPYAYPAHLCNALAEFADELPEVPVSVRGSSYPVIGLLAGSRLARLYGFGCGGPDIRNSTEDANALERSYWKSVGRHAIVCGETQSSSWESPYDGTRATVTATFNKVRDAGVNIFTLRWDPGADLNGTSQADWQQHVLDEIASRGGVSSFTSATYPYEA